MGSRLINPLIILSALALVCISPASLHIWQYGLAGLQRAPYPGHLSPTPEMLSTDIGLDGQKEYLNLDNGRAMLCRDALCEKPQWQSPESWDVKQAKFTELNQDGYPELALLVWRPFEPWPIDRFLVQGGRINSFQNKNGNSCHLIFIGWRDNRYRDLWAGSALADPLLTFSTVDLDGDGFEELIALEGTYNDPPDQPAKALTIWEWNGFGFTLLDRLQGPFQDMLLLTTDSNQPYILTHRLRSVR